MTTFPPPQAYIDPAHAALLVIDMQKGFCHPESQMEKAGIGTANQRAIIPDILRLVRVCREHTMPVFWSRQVHFPADVARQRRRIPSHLDKMQFWPCLKGTWETEFMEDIETAIRPEDYVVEKHRASMLFETTLPAKLRMLGTDLLIVSGCNTDFCVETTIRDAYFRDFEIVVVRECVASPNRAFHEDTLAKVQMYFGEVVSLATFPDLIMTPAAQPALR